MIIIIIIVTITITIIPVITFVHGVYNYIPEKLMFLGYSCSVFTISCHRLATQLQLTNISFVLHVVLFRP